MSTLEAALRAIVVELGRRRVRCALVGGLAVSARAEARTTRDVDLAVPAATLGHLVALKVLSRDDRTRPRDAEDLRALLSETTPADVASARAALERITALGFRRGKDLAAALDGALADLALQGRPGASRGLRVLCAPLSPRLRARRGAPGSRL